MSEAELLQVARVAFMAGASGVLLMFVLTVGVLNLWAWVGTFGDKQTRIRDARWRARWNGFKREAEEQGLRGRDAVLWAANAMRTHRQVLADLSAKTATQAQPDA